MFSKRCLSVVMVVLLVQPQLLICNDDLDQPAEREVVAEAPVSAPGESQSGQTAVQRKTEVTLPTPWGPANLVTDNRYVQLAIAAIVVMAAYQYFKPSLPK